MPGAVCSSGDDWPHSSLVLGSVCKHRVHLCPNIVRNKLIAGLSKTLYGFVVTIALSRSLIEQGFHPTGFCGEGDGWLASLCLAGMVDVETCMARLLGERRPLQLKRPYCTVFDPVEGRKLLPLRFTPAYLQQLTEQKDIGEEALRHYVERARLLIASERRCRFSPTLPCVQMAVDPRCLIGRSSAGVTSASFRCCLLANGRLTMLVTKTQNMAAAAT